MNGYFEPLGVPLSFVTENAQHLHSGGGGTKRAISEIEPEKLAALKKYFATEYQIYRKLCELAQK